MRGIDISRLDYTTWPGVDIESLSSSEKCRYSKLSQAIIARINGDPYKECYRKFKVTRSELRRCLLRCIETHSDGRQWGFRALVYHKHIRNASISKLLARKEKNGTRDSFRILADEHEEIFSEIKKRFLRRKLNAGFHESRMPLKSLHLLLLTRLREAGVGANEYPFNVINMGFVSMKSYLNKIYQDNIISGARARIGDDVARRLMSSMNEVNEKPKGYPYKRVLADGHRLHAFMSVELPDLNGDSIITSVNRPWLFLLMDESSRAILGYHLSLNSEYTQVDVMEAVKSALTPWKPKDLTISGLEYNPGGGLPGGAIPELIRAGWEEFLVDNAKANLANLVKERLHALVGCNINAGPVNMPERRSVIERIFKTLVDCGFSRLPSTTGSGPKDGRRRNPEKNAVEYEIMLHEIEELLDVIIANYNATPNSGVLNGRSPLEFISLYLNKGGIIPIIPEERIMNNNFFSIRVVVTVRGGVKQARAPYVNFQCVTYTSDLLRQSPFLVGKTLTLVVNIDDLRMVQAYFDDGTDFGVLTAHGAWGVSPHDLKTRKAINRLRNEGKLSYFETSDPIIAYERYKQSKASDRKSLKTASKRESLKRKRASSKPNPNFIMGDFKNKSDVGSKSDISNENLSSGFDAPPGGILR